MAARASAAWFQAAPVLRPQVIPPPPPPSRSVVSLPGRVVEPSAAASWSLGLGGAPPPPVVTIIPVGSRWCSPSSFSFGGLSPRPRRRSCGYCFLELWARWCSPPSGGDGHSGGQPVVLPLLLLIRWSLSPAASSILRLLLPGALGSVVLPPLPVVTVSGSGASAATSGWSDPAALGSVCLSGPGVSAAILRLIGSGSPLLGVLLRLWRVCCAPLAFWFRQPSDLLGPRWQ